MYSGHDITISSILVALGLFKPHQPPYGSSIIVEVYEISDRGYGIKVKVFIHLKLVRLKNIFLFQLYYAPIVGEEPKLLKLEECAELCPLEQFISIAEKLYPRPEEECYAVK